MNGFGFGLGGQSAWFGLVLAVRDDWWCGSVLVLHSTLIGYGLGLVQLLDHCQAYPELRRGISSIVLSLFSGKVSHTRLSTSTK
jgi:hypothetical protein